MRKTYIAHDKVVIPNTTTGQYPDSPEAKKWISDNYPLERKLSVLKIRMLEDCSVYTGQELNKDDAVFYPDNGEYFIARPFANPDDSDD